MNNRRRLVIALGTCVVSGTVFAQAKKPPIVIGWLSINSREREAQRIATFIDLLAALGWKERSQFLIEARWTEGQPDRVQPLAKELVAKKPAVVVAISLSAASAATKAAPDIPIVVSGADMIAAGLAKSLARPGGMVTGVTNVSGTIVEKYLELLLAAAPNVRRVGFLVASDSAAYDEYTDAMRRSVAQYKVNAHLAAAGTRDEIAPAIARLASMGVQGLIVLSSTGLFNTERKLILSLALAQHWPVIARGGAWVQEGALLSYSASSADPRLAYYVDRILRGAKPGDLPIEQPLEFELVVNLKTAKALGLTMPPEIMVRATRVIE